MDSENTSADVCTPTPTPNLLNFLGGYQARPAQVGRGDRGFQRRFGADLRDAQGLLPMFHGGTAVVTVIRSGRTDQAELQLAVGLWTQSSAAVCLTPAELRDVATRLLDAAHDIETHPAVVLATALEGRAA